MAQLARGILAVLVSIFCLQLVACAGARTQNHELAESVSQREVEIRLDLADAYLRNNEPRLSLRELLRIQDAAASMPRFYFTLGYTYFVLDNWAAATKALQEAVALDPDHAEAWNNLGLAYLAGNDFDSAQDAFTRALSVPTYRTPEIVALNMALLHMERNDPEKSRQYVNLALELNWRFSRAYLLAAEIEVGQGDLDAAIDILERGVEGDLTNLRMMLTLAEYLLLAGKNTEAALWLDRVLTEAGPQTPEAATALEYLRALGRQNAPPMGEGGKLSPRPQSTDGSESLPEKDSAKASAPPSMPESTPEKGAGSEQPPIYIAQVGGFLVQDRAEALRELYADRGYPAGTVEVEHIGKTWFLVFVGKGEDREEVRGIAERFQERENAESVVTRISMGRYLAPEGH